MPQCVICGEKWYHATQIDPHETCACGNEVDESYVEEYDQEDVEAMKRRWKEEQEDDGA